MNEEDDGEYNGVEPSAGRRDMDAQLLGNTGRAISWGGIVLLVAGGPRQISGKIGSPPNPR